MDEPLQWVGVVLATAAAASALVIRDPRARVAAMALALALAPVLIAVDSWESNRFGELRDNPARLALGAGAAAVGIGLLAALFVRIPAAVAPVAIAVLPFRIPIGIGGSSANLLLPLYGVIAAAVLAAAVLAFRRRAEAARSEQGGEAEDPLPPGRGPARWLTLVLGAAVFLYAIQSAYAEGSFEKALENLAFFLIPFTVLFVVLSTVRWTPRLLVVVFGVVVAEAVIFALVGFWEYGTRQVFWNQEVITANEVHSYFRINSLFWDPNILGRYLAVTILAVASYMVWTRNGARAGVAAALCGLLLVALALTFSQSGLAALAAGLVALAALRWSLRWTMVVAGAVLATGLAVLVANGTVGDLTSERSLDEQTSGRAKLIRGGIDLAEDEPLIGNGSGSFERAFQRRFRGTLPDDAATASHTEPVTVAAEQGLVGLLLYLALIGVAIATLLAGMRRLAPGFDAHGSHGARAAPTGEEADPHVVVARVAIVCAFIAMLVHSLSYAAFLSDPITWALLALGLALASRSPAAAIGAR